MAYFPWGMRCSLYPPACLWHCFHGERCIAFAPPRVYGIVSLEERCIAFAIPHVYGIAPKARGVYFVTPVPPRPQARQTNRGPRRATMPACRPLHRNKSTSAGQQFGQAGHRRRANYITQVFWAIACSTRWACWPIDRPQTRCFFWLLFFSAEKKSDEPRPAGRGTRPAGRPPAPAGAYHAPRRRKARAAGAPPAPRRRKAAPRRRKAAPQAQSRAAGAKPRRRRKKPRPIGPGARAALPGRPPSGR